MGVFVEFREARADGIASVLLGEIASLREWVTEHYTDPPAGFDAAPIELIEEVARRGSDALSPETAREAAQLDALVDLFIGDYCDWGPGRRLFPAAHRSMLYLWHYEGVLDVVEQSGSTLLVRFSRAIAEGRPVGRDPACLPYHPSDSVFRVSFLTSEEVAELSGPLEDLRRQRTRGVSERGLAALRSASEAVSAVLERGLGLLITAA